MQSTAALLHSTLSEQPAVLAALNEAHDAAWAATDSTVLEMCRLRMCALLGNVDEQTSSLADEIVAEIPLWHSSTRLSPAQRACLAFTEEFVIDVASLSDSTAGAVIAELGDQGFADFVNALLVVEQRQRMRLAWQKLFGGG